MWQPIAKTKLGDVDLQKPSSIQTFNLSAAGVPHSAKEVLIYITLRTGWDTGRSDDIEVAVWTTDGVLEYKKYLYGHLYGQDAWSYNSENMSFPVTPDLTLNAQFSGPPPTQKLDECQVYVIGYRLWRAWTMSNTIPAALVYS